MAIKFLSFTPTPTAKFLGIAELEVDVTFQDREVFLILRYRVQEVKEGKGFFIRPANIAVPAGDPGKYDNFDGAYFESKKVDEHVQKLIRQEVNKFLADKPIQKGFDFGNNAQSDSESPF